MSTPHEGPAGAAASESDPLKTAPPGAVASGAVTSGAVTSGTAPSGTVASGAVPPGLTPASGDAAQAAPPRADPPGTDATGTAPPHAAPPHAAPPHAAPSGSPLVLRFDQNALPLGAVAAAFPGARGSRVVAACGSLACVAAFAGLSLAPSRPRRHAGGGGGGTGRRGRGRAGRGRRPHRLPAGRARADGGAACPRADPARERRP